MRAGLATAAIWALAAAAGCEHRRLAVDGGAPIRADAAEAADAVEAGPSGSAGQDSPAPHPGPPVHRHVFVVAVENHDAAQIYGNAADAPYINEALLPVAARATHFRDVLPSLASEPHYLWMEAGTNEFSDHTFLTNADPSAENSTASKDHLVAQLGAAGRSWMTYQEDIDERTGACPITSAGQYTARHNPFVFFHDVSGMPPSRDDPACAAHHKPYTALAADLAAGQVADYVFVKPNLCHDMHGNGGCPPGSVIRAGDDWLREALPPILAFVQAHDGVLFLTWEEGASSAEIPFLALGPHVKAGHAGDGDYDHSSMLKSIEILLGVPPLPTVAGAKDLGDLFAPGTFP